MKKSFWLMPTYFVCARINIELLFFLCISIISSSNNITLILLCGIKKKSFFGSFARGLHDDDFFLSQCISQKSSSAEHHQKWVFYENRNLIIK